MAVKFGTIVPQGWRLDLRDIADPVDKYEMMTHTAQEAERLGYDSIWVYDHFHTVPQQELETTFECWTATAGLARDTSTIRIGQLVTCNNYRNPALLAKIASTVDVMSHGRLDFGIGAGWYEEEFNAYGYPYPDGPERLRMLREALQIIKAMWTEDYATFEGQYYQVRGAINEPKGVQKPHPPIWVGGGGERVTLKLVAQYGDACNITGTTPDAVRHKFDVLREHCATVGRDYESIIKSHHTFIYLLEPGESADQALSVLQQYMQQPDLTLEQVGQNIFVGTATEVTDWLHSLEAVGTQYFVIYFRNYMKSSAAGLDAIRRFAAEVLPAFR
jgi:F420-dependent oxidoreductase-like protein